MAIVEVVRRFVRSWPRTTTGAISILGYLIVAAGFAGMLPVPQLSASQVATFADLIALVNLLALASLIAGWRFIRRGRVRRHRAAMLTAFGFILVFLTLYLWKVSGGFTKVFVVPADAPLAAHASLIRGIYLGLLAIHVVLSILCVPVVVHAVVLGLTHTVDELPETVHPRVGKIAVAAWSISLTLGVLTYFLLMVYDSRPRDTAMLGIVLAVPIRIGRYGRQ